MDKIEKKRLANEKRLQAIQQWKKNRNQQNNLKSGPPKITVPPKESTKGKLKLFGSDEEEDNEDKDLNFNIRPQFEGERGKHLLEMSSELSSRFKLDERFKDDNEPIEVAEQNEEKAKNIKILESILGHEVNEKYPDGRDSKKKKRQMRFDPEDENAAKFIKINSTSEADIPKKKKETKEAIERPKPKEIPVSSERFIEVSSNLKDLLQSSPTPFTLTAKFSTNHDEASSILSNDFFHPKPVEASQKIKPRNSTIQHQSSQSTGNIFENQNRMKFFFSKDDTRLKEGIEFFQRPKSLDAIREEWNKKRCDVKLNSEYKRNFVWHPQYKPLAQDVISCAPQSIFKEASIQRRKQYPDLAYRSNEVIRHDLGNSSKDVLDSRARSEERDVNLASKSGPRSRSAEPGMRREHNKIMVQSFPPITAGRVSTLPKTDECPDISEGPCETTEYKSQFAWPQKAPNEPTCMARKSISMNVIKSSDYTTDFSVPKCKIASVQRPCNKQKDSLNLEKIQEVKKKVKTEYKAKYKPFTSYVYVDGEWKKTSSLLKVPENIEEDHAEPWFVEVVERVQRANDYRRRGHGQPVGQETPEITKPKLDVLVHRSKRVPTDLPLNQPNRCHQNSSKRGDNKKKESYIEAVGEKKPSKEIKKHPLRRPKSAEPAKPKDTVKYKRPATTPPAKSTVHSLPPRNRMPKVG